MDDKSQRFCFFFQMLQEIEEGMSKEKEKQVMIEKAINLRLMCDYVVSCSYGDVVLIICMLRDYVKMLDEIRDDILWKIYYREKFIKMADRLSDRLDMITMLRLKNAEKNRKSQKNPVISGKMPWRLL